MFWLCILLLSIPFVFPKEIPFIAGFIITLYVGYQLLHGVFWGFILVLVVVGVFAYMAGTAYLAEEEEMKRVREMSPEEQEEWWFWKRIRDYESGKVKGMTVQDREKWEKIKAEQEKRKQTSGIDINVPERNA